jgi:phosphate transport system permease protein
MNVTPLKRTRIMTEQRAFTGRARRKETRWGVRALDVVSRWVITVGGIGTVAAVSTVFLLLLWVVFPLLLPAKTGNPGRMAADGASRALRIGVDDYHSIAWVLRDDGTIVARAFDTGAQLEARRLFPGKTITAAAFAAGGTSVAFGFDDGTVALGHIGFATTFLDQATAPAELQRLAAGARTVAGQAIAQRISPAQLRLQRLDVSFDEPAPGVSTAAVRLLDRSGSGAEGAYAELHADGGFQLVRLARRENMLTGEVVTSRIPTVLPAAQIPGKALPSWLLLSDSADSVLLAWPDGSTVRYLLRDQVAAPIMEQVSLLEDRSRTVTALAWLLGRTTVLAGDSSGRIGSWFPVRSTPGAPPILERARLLEGAGRAVTALATSSRSRLLVAGFADGTVEVRHATSQKLLARVQAATGRPVDAVALAPKDDGIVALAGGSLAHWEFDPGHPESSVRSLFLPVWYEGAPGPAHVWQSSAATDDFEPKFGLLPLIFGTLKATLYSLVFGVPIALLAAIFTSEFLTPRLRGRIKPVVELMASLPSVVLGFLAALVIAPFVAGRLADVLALILVGPVTFLWGAYLWQLIPYRLTLRFQRWRFPAMFLAIPATLLGARALGPLIERYCFAGNILRWLDGGIGGAAGGWAYLLVAPSGLAVLLLIGRYVNPCLSAAARSWPRGKCALIELGKFVGGLLAAILLAAIAGNLLAALGSDPRGPLLGTYVQRNSLVVGFVMGFAIIPIIYTIAEDALAAVPDHLRSASLASGATPWQTAWRIVIPTATSGLFSAVMIGLGRAVGETMIVLMAAGNTPILDWNVFNGFRTLSANIAVELPEAVRNSTHYRTLFLAALVLFMITFVLNTCAELVRISFRKKTREL